VEALERLAPDRLADQVEQLAYHAARGAEWDKALIYGRQAGARAYDRAAFREAVACFEQALAALAQCPERRDTQEQAIDLRLDLRHALQTLDELARLFDHLCEAEALAERLGDDRRLGQIVRHLAFYFSTIGEYDRAIVACQRALALATSSDAFDVQVAVETTLSRTYYSGGDFRQALDIARWTITLLAGKQHYASFGRGNLQVCPPGTWNTRMLVETVLSMLTTVFHSKTVGHRVWASCRARVAWTMAACNLLARWGLAIDDEHMVRLSIAECGL
jgi:tetratricopeptide (TPR) repeat protein